MIVDLDIEDIGVVVQAVDVQHSDCDKSVFASRFPETRAQMHGVVTDVTGVPQYLRWVANNHMRFGNKWDAQAGCLEYAVPPRTESFLRYAFSRSTIPSGGLQLNVLLLVGPRSYDVGRFAVKSLAGGRLSLQRELHGGGPLGYITQSPLGGTIAKVSEDGGGQQPLPPGSQGDSLLETRYRRLFRFWGITVSYDRPLLPYTAEGNSLYTPDGVMHNALGDSLRTWCSVENWHPGCCLLEIKPTYPSQAVFEKTKSVVMTHHWPLALVYGSPAIRASVADLNYGVSGMVTHGMGTMVILIRPMDGRTTRAYFDWDDASSTMVLQRGEAGEYGPPHHLVTAGHQLIAMPGDPRTEGDCARVATLLQHDSPEANLDGIEQRVLRAYVL